MESSVRHGGSAQTTVEAMIQRTAERMYTESEGNPFLEVTHANGDKEVLYFKDFNSGAMIENIVVRAKKMAIKEFLDTGQKGIRVSHLPAACVDAEDHRPHRQAGDARACPVGDRLKRRSHSL